MHARIRVCIGASYVVVVVAVTVVVVVVVVVVGLIASAVYPLMMSLFFILPADDSFSQHQPHAKLQWVHVECAEHLLQQSATLVLATLGASGW